MYEALKAYVLTSLLKKDEDPKTILSKELANHESEDKFLSEGYKNKIIYCLGKKYLPNRVQKKLASDKSVKVRVSLAYNSSININTIETLAEDAERFSFKYGDQSYSISPVLSILDRFDKYKIDSREKNEVINVMIEYHPDLFDKIAAISFLNIENAKEMIFYGEGLSVIVATHNTDKKVLDFLYKDHPISRPACLQNENFDTTEHVKRFNYLGEDEQAALVEISKDRDFVEHVFENMKGIMSNMLAEAFMKTGLLSEDEEIEVFNHFVRSGMDTDVFKELKNRVIIEKIARNERRGEPREVNDKDILIFDFINLIEISSEEKISEIKDYVLNSLNGEEVIS